VADFGEDVSTFVDGDLDPFFRPVSGFRAVAEAILRRWTTPTGALFWDPAFGRDVRSLLSQAFTPQAAFALRASLASQAEDDERVLEAVVDVALDQQRRELRIRAEIHTADGPFSLVARVDQLSIELLSPT